MNLGHFRKWCLLAALATVGTTLGLHSAVAAQPGPADTEEGVQVLTRGPVHEAFAETVTFDPEPGIVVPKAPPAAIEELPPDQRPEGANVAWMPGYWGWDDERSDFLWVSGVWRALPPGREWVPGYWGRLSQGFQWTSGYWADAQASEEGVQVLTRGPVHEAFAETVTFDPEPGIVVPKAPPAAIEELPPDQRPEGANVAWIPGYWGWDDERSDFLWVSGVWRALPPGRQWVPGYWGRLSQGFQWTSGYWADAQASEVEYLPEPPATVEVGPNIAAPSADHMWLPGCWVWNQSRYAWRPGFWATAQSDWVWNPAHYVWAPRGYVFVDGYWDYSIGRRGVLFAPVYFHHSLYSRPGFSYSPSMVIDLGVFTNHLFLRPQYQHYYFGDYYAADYQTAGFYASYSYHSNRYGYDPIYAHQRWQYRQEPGWEHRVAAEFQNRRDHEDLRPPHNWAAQRALATGDAAFRERRFAVAAMFSEVTKRPGSPLRFQHVDLSERQELGKRGREVHRFRDQRQKLEASVAAPSAGLLPKQLEPTRVPLPRSPIAASPVAEIAKELAPPRTHSAPGPDSKAEPRPRVTRGPGGPQQHKVGRMPLDQPAPQPQPRAERPARQRQPKAERPAPQPQPRAERPAPQPQPQPGAERPAPQPQPKADQPAPQPQPKAERPAPQPQPGAERPAPQPQPKAERPARQRQPKAERPAPQPQPKAERPAPQPQPKAERPAPQPQPRAERPAPQPQPRAERPAPQPQPRAERPAPQPQPRAERPAPQTQPKAERPARQRQPKAERPAPQPQPGAERPAPQPQPRAERPAPQPQPKAERPAPQPQPRAERPAPQPQPKAERPAPQPQPKAERPDPQPQPKAERPDPQPQPKAERPDPQPGSNAPAESKRGKDQDKEKGKDKQ